MKRAEAEFEALLASARGFAAVREAFAPGAALAEVMGARARAEPVTAARVLSALRQDCTVEAGASGDERWLMRPTARRKALGAGGASAAGGATEADTPVAAALAGRGLYAPEALDRMVAGGDSPEEMEAAAVALDRAGPAAPGFDRLLSLRSALNARRAEARTDARLAAGFFGREAELARLADWIAAPQPGPPLRTIHVSGLAGIGKSFLLERVIQMARLSGHPILVLLDFDRAGLNVIDAHAFFEEVSRQIGDALPDAALRLRDLRLRSAERRAAATGSSASYSLPRELLLAMGKAVVDSGRRMVAVLDTLEALRSRGETQVMTLFDRFDALAAHGITPLVLISAGRGDALDPVPTRVEERIRLEGLEDSAARLLLRTRDVPEAIWPRILPLARGNPLLLMLAAKAFEDAGYDAAEIPAGADAETIGGYLYRAVLSRVPEQLRQIANEGLILRTVDAAALTGIVAPALGLALTEAEARAALDELATHHWLVERDGAGLRHRADVRRAFLPLLYEGPPATRAAAEAVNLAAAGWYASTDPPAALYHRLQATRFGHPMPELPPAAAAALVGAVLDELPGPARDAVLQAQGRRSGYARAPGAKGAPPLGPPTAEESISAAELASLLRKAGLAEDEPENDPARTARAEAAGAAGDAAPSVIGRRANRPRDARAARDLEVTLEQGDLREAAHVFAAAFGPLGASAAPTGQAALSYLWLSGHWSVAYRMMSDDPTLSRPEMLEESPHLHGRVVLEIAAENGFADFVRHLRTDEKGFERACAVHEASQRIGMAGGALDFAFLACGRPEEVLPRRLDLARSLLASARDGDGARSEAEPALAAAASLRQSFGLFHEPPAAGGPDDRDPGVRAEMLQALNPYGAALHHVVTEEPEGRVAAFLEGLRPRLAAVAAQLLPDLRGADPLPGRLSGGAPDVVAALTAMGLAADWSSMHVIGRSRADLRLIAAAAERWRRTVSGLWSYGRLAPAGWPRPGEDRLSVRRLARLAQAEDPVAAARAALAVWGGLSDTGATRRFGAWCDAAGAALRKADAEAAGRPAAALGALLAAGAPGIAAAPLAILMAHRAAPGRPDRAAPIPDPG